MKESLLEKSAHMTCSNAGDLVIVGAGVSTIFGVLYLLENGYDGKKIRIVEKGPSIFDKDRSKNILEGFGGAGAYSDFKCIFSKYEDTSVVSFFGLEKVEEDHSFIKKMIEKFHPDLSKIGKSQPSEKLNNMVSSLEGWGDISIAQSESWHIGTDLAHEFLKNVESYLKENGVEIYFNTTLINILDKYNKYVTVDSKEWESYNSPSVQNRIEELKERRLNLRREIRAIKKSGEDYYKIEDLERTIEGIKITINRFYPTLFERYYSKLVLALGKGGKKFLDSYVEKKNIKIKKNVAQIGVRFETPYTEDIKNISDEQYDFKFFKNYLEDKMRIRTFCVNHYSAYVAIEDVDDFEKRIQFNGHAYGLNNEDKKNGLSNWGIIAECQVKDADKYIQDILEKSNYEGLVVKGDSVIFKSSLEDKINSDIKEISKDNFIKLYGNLGKNILNFVELVNKKLKYDENYLMFVPEIKISSGKIPSKDGFKLDSFENIFCLGDLSHLQTRGIVPAATHFIEFSKKITKRKG